MLDHGRALQLDARPRNGASPAGAEGVVGPGCPGARLVPLGAGTAAWTQACVGTCPRAAELTTFAPQQAKSGAGRAGRAARLVPPGAAYAGTPEHPPRLCADGALSPLRTGAFLPMTALIRAAWWVLWWTTREGLARLAAAPSPCSSPGICFRSSYLPAKNLPAQDRRDPDGAGHRANLLQTQDPGAVPESYLSRRGCIRVEAAARTYFNSRPPSSPLWRPPPLEGTLVLHCLAGLQGASFYNLRRNLVLAAMADEGVISPEQAGAAQQQPPFPRPGRGTGLYFVEAVRNQLEDQFGELLYTGGHEFHRARSSSAERLRTKPRSPPA